MWFGGRQDGLQCQLWVPGDSRETCVWRILNVGGKTCDKTLGDHIFPCRPMIQRQTKISKTLTSGGQILSEHGI